MPATEYKRCECCCCKMSFFIQAHEVARECPLCRETEALEDKRGYRCGHLARVARDFDRAVAQDRSRQDLSAWQREMEIDFSPPRAAQVELGRDVMMSSLEVLASRSEQEALERILEHELHGLNDLFREIADGSWRYWEEKPHGKVTIILDATRRTEGYGLVRRFRARVRAPW